MQEQTGSCILWYNYIGELLDMPQQHDTKLLPYPQWLQQWLGHLALILLFSKTPIKATSILTPLRYATWRCHLQPHPHQDLV